MIGMILCGGMAKRLRPLTQRVPKVLLELKPGYTLLDRQLLQYKSAGIEKVILLTGHLSEKIERRIGRERFGVCIDYVRERKPLGTLNAIRLGMRKAKDDVVVSNGDVVCDLNLRRMWMRWRHSKAWGSMYIVRMRSPYGVVKTRGGRITGFEEKPLLSCYINGGFYCLSHRVLPLLERYKTGDIEKTVFPELARAGRFTYYKEDGIYWISVDTLKDLEAAQREYSNRRDTEWGYEKAVGSGKRLFYVMAGHSMSTRGIRVLKVVRGRGVLRCGNRSWRVRTGSRVFLKSSEEYTLRARANTWVEGLSS